MISFLLAWFRMRCSAAYMQRACRGHDRYQSHSFSEQAGKVDILTCSLRVLEIQPLPMDVAENVSAVGVLADYPARLSAASDDLATVFLLHCHAPGCRWR